MDDLSSKISALLQNPDSLGQIQALAKSMSGKSVDPMALLGAGNEKVALLKALKPLVSDRKKEAVEEVISILQVLSLFGGLK